MSETLLQLIVQGTLTTLVLFSVATWALVLVKGVQALRNRRHNGKFREARGAGLPTSSQLERSTGPEARVTRVAISTWNQNGRLRSLDTAARELLEIRLKQQIQRERRASEAGLAVFATVGTTSPFVGLFGTVWGIMGALIRIGATGEAGIEVVAGPIGEALIATGVGIAVAVPAVIAFNFFARRLKSQISDLEDLAQSLVADALLGRLELRFEGEERGNLAVSGTIERPSELQELAALQSEARA